MRNNYKICSRCGSEQYKNQFYRDYTKKDGRKNICRSCLGIKRSSRFKFIESDIESLMKNHKNHAVKYMGFLVGFIVIIGKGEFLAVSVLKGKKVFHRKNDCEAWLVHRVSKAAKVLEAGLLKRLKDYEVK